MPSRPISSSASSLARPLWRALLAPPSHHASWQQRLSSSVMDLWFRRSLWRPAGRGLFVLCSTAAAVAGSGCGPARRCRGLTVVPVGC